MTGGKALKKLFSCYCSISTGSRNTLFPNLLLPFYFISLSLSVHLSLSVFGCLSLNSIQHILFEISTVKNCYRSYYPLSFHQNMLVLHRLHIGTEVRIYLSHRHIFLHAGSQLYIWSKRTEMHTITIIHSRSSTAGLTFPACYLHSPCSNRRRSVGYSNA